VKHPMQSVFLDGKGVVRFRANAVVAWLLGKCREFGIDMNDIALEDFPREDRVQFAQLIGYSVAGFHELSYVSDGEASAASGLARRVLPAAGGCRDKGCSIHSQGGEEAP
jgi:hypothetical protein